MSIVLKSPVMEFTLVFLSKSCDNSVPSSVLIGCVSGGSSEVRLAEVSVIERCLAQADVLPTLELAQVGLQFGLKQVVSVKEVQSSPVL